jgi:hypothetical protein
VFGPASLLAALTPLLLGFTPGPASVPNHHPLYIGLLVPPPSSASPVDRTVWSVAFDHTNIFLLMADRTWSVHQDMELTAATVTGRFPLGEGVEAGFSAPLYYQSGGFTDGAIRWWHDVIGVPGYAGQDRYGDDRYANTLYRSGVRMIDPRPYEPAPGDVTVWVKGTVREGEGYVVSGELYWQLPTGVSSAGMGNGAHEGAVRIVGAVDGPAGSRFTGGAGVSIPQRLKGFRGEAELSAMALWFGAVEAPFPRSDRWSLLLQSQGNTSPLPGALGHPYARPFTEATVGFRYRGGEAEAPRWWTVALSENLNQTNPDYTLHLSVEW